ncbi:amidohydrolase family protein [Leeuwenhoekiella palythoae]|uniref:amidohydrolase family protein n=1 Tax=Leeuwenhoekiella palythoae TaxID=573501 RepID=UPI0035169F80
MIIDSHQHFWNYNSQRHSWISEDMNAIRRDFLPEDLYSLYKANDISGCIAVQADQTLDENQFLLQLCQEHKFIKGVIGWVDFQQDGVESILEEHDYQPLIKGYRHVVQNESDNTFLLRPRFVEGISLLKNRNLVYEILVYWHQLPAVLEFAKLFPNQQFVVDHIAKPDIKNKYRSAWELLIKELAKFSNVSCKISGMVTEADFNNWDLDQFLPYMDVVLEAFGSDRIMYGSDWPVCLVAANYSQVLHIAKSFANQLSTDEQANFFYKNALRTYNL